MYIGGHSSRGKIDVQIDVLISLAYSFACMYIGRNSSRGRIDVPIDLLVSLVY